MATMDSEKFNLKWNDFESSISGSFREIKEEKDFMDVTLACEENQIGAHRVVLAACSPKLRSILRSNSHHHPLLYLRGIKYTDLQSLITFMYHGEVNIAQEELDSFLSVAEELKIKGLTQSCSSTQPESQTKKPRISQNSSNIRQNTVAKSRPREEQQDIVEVEEIPAIKTEPSGGSLSQYEEPEEVGEYEYQEQEEHYEESDPSTTEYPLGKPAGDIIYHLSGVVFCVHKKMSKYEKISQELSML